MFSGSIVALMTPFLKGKIDEISLKKMVHWHIDQGTKGLVVCGSTGETALLTPEERHHVIHIVMAENKGRLPVIIGCGAPSTNETLAWVQKAKALGGQAALIVTPYYVKPTEGGIFEHFRVLNDQGGLPLLLYNNASRAGVGLSVELVVRLSHLPFVVGIKDSCNDLTRLIQLRQRIQKSFTYLSGDDPLVAAYLAHGGDGVISVSANVMPKLCQKMIDAWQKGNLPEFALLRDHLFPLHESLFIESSPAPVKYIAHRLGLITSDEVRLPLVPISPKSKDILDGVIDTVIKRVPK